MSQFNSFNKYAPYLSFGVEMAVGITLPILAGYWLDDYLQTGPWLLLAGCVVGFVNVFLIIFRLNKKLNNDM